MLAHIETLDTVLYENISSFVRMSGLKIVSQFDEFDILIQVVGNKNSVPVGDSQLILIGDFSQKQTVPMGAICINQSDWLVQDQGIHFQDFLRSLKIKVQQVA